MSFDASLVVNTIRTPAAWTTSPPLPPLLPIPPLPLDLFESTPPVAVSTRENNTCWAFDGTLFLVLFEVARGGAEGEGETGFVFTYVLWCRPIFFCRSFFIELLRYMIEHFSTARRNSPVNALRRHDKKCVLASFFEVRFVNCSAYRATKSISSETCLLLPLRPKMLPIWTMRLGGLFFVTPDWRKTG